MPGPVQVYAGVDVACGLGRRLPLCIVTLEGGRPLPLALPGPLAAAIPAGLGNAEVAAAVPFRAAARQAAAALRGVVDGQGWRLMRIFIDAPARPPERSPRMCEQQLGAAGLSSFRTPSADRWPAIRDACAAHLHAGGAASSLPYANMIWMLYGFELFAALRGAFGACVFETYPYAIVQAVLPGCRHKSTEAGYQNQLSAVAGRTGWDPAALETRLKQTVPGRRHDRLDAYMAAWAASLPLDRIRAYGDPADKDDAIWVPECGSEFCASDGLNPC